MSRFHPALLALLLILPLPTFAQPASSIHVADSILADRGELRFSFDAPTRESLRAAAALLSVERIDGPTVIAWANTTEFRRFLTTELPWRILSFPAPPPVMRTAAPPSGGTWDFYPSEQEYLRIMQRFVDRWPDLCRLDTIAVLRSGRLILALRISRDVHMRRNTPRVLFTSSIHGNETSGFMLMLRLIDHLLSTCDTDTQSRRIVDNVELWINPLANPDGTYRGTDTTVASARRYNANSVDLNRNYRDPENGDHPDAQQWQEETVAFMELARRVHFTASVNFHDGAELYNHPWDTWVRRHADDAWWTICGRAWADTAHAHSEPGYFDDEQNGVTDGYDWYEVNGGRQDFMNYFGHCREATVEICRTMLVAPTELPRLWEAQHRSMLRTIDRSLLGLRGIVTDSLDGRPLLARLEIPGHDTDNTWIESELPIGDYHRLLATGRHTIVCSAPGYVTKTITGVDVDMDATDTLDIALVPLRPVAGFLTDVDATCDGTVRFTDTSTASVTRWSWDFGDGTTTTERNPVHRYSASGSFDVRLRVASSAGEDSVTHRGCVVVTLPDAPLAQDAERCGPGAVTLTATGDGSIAWYTTPEASAPAAEGGALPLPRVARDTTLWVADRIFSPPMFVGKKDSLGDGGYYSFTNTHYEIFTTESELILRSALVHALTAGPRTIELRDALGTLLFTTTIPIPAGSGRIALDIPLPRGAGLQLGVKGANNLYRNTVGTRYPYTIPGVIAITGNSAGDPDFWYFLFDWEVQRPPCVSARTAVRVHISDAPPVARIGMQPEGMQVRFTDSSTAATRVLWRFGDGDTSSARSPVHVYPRPGEYDVVLIAVNACGSDSTRAHITLTRTGIAPIHPDAELTVHPNPVMAGSRISIQSTRAFLARVSVHDLLGRTLVDATTSIGAGTGILPIDTRLLPTGGCVLRIAPARPSEQGGRLSTLLIIR